MEKDTTTIFFGILAVVTVGLMSYAVSKEAKETGKMSEEQICHYINDGRAIIDVQALCLKYYK